MWQKTRTRLHRLVDEQPIILLQFVTGLLVAIVAPAFRITGDIRDLLLGIGGGLASAAIGALIALPVAERATRKQEGIIQNGLEEIRGMIKLGMSADKLGITAIAYDKADKAFGGDSFRDRCERLLQHGKEFDILCYEDETVLGSASVLHSHNDEVARRVKTGELKLRILYSQPGNPVVQRLENWFTASDQKRRKAAFDAKVRLTESTISQLKDLLPKEQIVAKAHSNQIVPFTLVRGKDANGEEMMYCMLHIPRTHIRPIIELQQHGELFAHYSKYFEWLWNRPQKPSQDLPPERTESQSVLAPTPDLRT